MKIYYSRSNEVDDAYIIPHITEFIENLPNRNKINVELTSHERGTTYTSDKLLAADLVIVGTRDMDAYPWIAKGCYTEIENALNHNIPVLVLSIIDGLPFIQVITTTDLILRDDNNWNIGYGTINLYDYSEELNYKNIGSQTSDSVCIDLMLKNLWEGDIYDKLFYPEYYQSQPEMGNNKVISEIQNQELLLL